MKDFYLKYNPHNLKQKNNSFNFLPRSSSVKTELLLGKGRSFFTIATRYRRAPQPTRIYEK